MSGTTAREKRIFQLTAAFGLLVALYRMATHQDFGSWLPTSIGAGALLLGPWIWIGIMDGIMAGGPPIPDTSPKHHPWARYKDQYLAVTAVIWVAWLIVPWLAATPQWLRAAFGRVVFEGPLAIMILATWITIAVELVKRKSRSTQAALPKADASTGRTPSP